MVRECFFRSLANRPSKSQFGYGVQDGGWLTEMSHCHGENHRGVVWRSRIGDTDDGTNITTVAGITVEGGVFENVASNAAVSIGSAGYTLEVALTRVTARMLAGSNPSRGFDLAGTSTTVRAVDCVADFARFATATNTAGFNVASDGVVLRARRFRFVGGAAPYTSATLVTSGGAGAGNGSDIEITDTEYDHASISPTTVASGVTKARYSGVIRFGTSWFNTLRSGTFNVVAAAGVSLTAVGRVADSLINVRFTGSAGDVTTGTLPGFTAGVTHGTQLVMVNASNGIVTIPTGSGLLPNTALPIPVDGCAVLTYFGDYWRIVAKTF